MEPTLQTLDTALDEIRPALKRDGGDVEVVGFEDGVVKVRLRGACGHCGFSAVTLKFGIEKVLKEKVPGVLRVESVK
ncbi:NifU family protein [Candidatus Uhrbacteria bacterium]|nr:NifU family protein [Candidatus Uhrbacteria bacterium]